MAFLEQVFDHLRLLLAAEEMAADGGHHFLARARPTLPEGVGFHVLIQQLIRVEFGAIARQLEEPEVGGIRGDKGFSDGRGVRRQSDTLCQCSGRGVGA